MEIVIHCGDDQLDGMNFMALRKASAASANKPATKAKAPPAKAPAKSTTGKAATSSSDVKAKSAPKKAAAPAVTVTLRHLAAELGEHHNLPKKEAETLVGDLFERLVVHLKAGDKLRLSGLGVLEIKHRAARMGRNPATGETIKIAASKKIAFRPAKDLKVSI
jgi:DNA-binding protein HU-beta